MREQRKEKVLAVTLVVLALLVAGCGVTPTPPPTPIPTPPPPTPTQPPASEAPVSAEEDVLGIWQVEGATEDPVLLIFAKFVKAGRAFSIFAGSQELDRGLFVVKENQLTFVTEPKSCHLCKGSYEAYVTKQEGRPARLRFVLNGQDPNAQRASALNGKAAVPLSGALPGEVPVSTIEDVNGVWQETKEMGSGYGPEWLTFQNGQFTYRNIDGVGAAGSIVVKDGKLVFNDVRGDGSYIVFVKRQSGQPVWLRFISTGDDEDIDRERILHGRILPLQPAP